MIDPLNTTFAEVLLATVASAPNRLAIALGDSRFTYREFAGAVGALQAGLQEMGVKPGDRVGLLMPNLPYFPLAFFAASCCGAEVVMCNPLHAPGEVAYILNDSEARWLVVSAALEEKVRAILPQCPGLQGVIVAGESALSNVASLDAMVQSNLGASPRPVEIDPTSPAVLMYTSGTTGRPKGAVLSHRNIIWDAAAADEVLHVKPTDSMICLLPLFHAYGFTVNLTLGVLRGLAMHLLPKFTAAGALGLMEAEGVTVLAAVPTMYQIMLRTRREPDYDLSRLRVAVSGGAPMPIEVLQAFEERFGTCVIEGYGPTEAAPVVSVNPVEGVRKLGSVGLPLPGIEVQIVDDDMKPLPTGEIGELCCRGPNVMLGYWKAPEATAETIVDGWLRTGDLARLDEDGYIYIVDRKKDMIIVGGMNVYPREVEDVLYRLPQVAECAVVGVPHGIKGEDVVAFIALKEDASLSAEETLEYCRKHLAPFKVPSYVFFEPELPKSPIGKILRREVRQMARSRLDL